MAYVVFSSSPKGHTWYGQLAKRWFVDYKGGVPILALAVPLLVMSSVSALLVTGRPSTNGSGAASPHNHRQQYSYMYAPRFWWLLALPCTLCKRTKQRLSRTSFDMLSFIFILIPCLIYFASGIYRHLYGHDLSADDQIMEIANAGGQTAMIALSFFLVPVSRHSVLLDLMGWSPEKAIRMHIWSGRICILGVLFHGLGHMLRWWIMNERVLYMLFPEMGCWKYHNEDYKTRSNCSDCSCYDLFRNFTGFVALVFLLVVGLSSLGYIRRASYNAFYTLHVIAGPASLLFAILHWNRMFLFICPSILYYAASTVPVLIRLLLSYINENGVKVISATDLSFPSSAGGEFMRSCVCLTFEIDDEAARQFSPGKYVKLSIPAISRISHPFTVNQVLGTKGRNQMQIIFRATGPFTGALANMLLTLRQINTSAGESTMSAPLMAMDGFYGQNNLTEKVLDHDVAVIVAGGVGITPYLSLIPDLCRVLQSTAEYFVDIEQMHEIQLHWICRDSALIDSVTRDYFAPLQTSIRGGSGSKKAPRSIRIFIHHTGRDISNGAVTQRYSGTVSTNEFDWAPQPRPLVLGSRGLPFSPARFSAGNTRILGNLPIFFAFSTIAWLGLVIVWFMYDIYVSKKEILSRAYGLLTLTPISLITGLVANIVLGRVDAENALISWTACRKHAYTGLGGENKGDQYEEQLTQANSEAGLSLQNLDSTNQEVVAKTADGNTDTEARAPSSCGLDNNELSAVSIEHSSGRPSVMSILSCLETAHSPGIFVCGPSAMVKDVKYSAR